jgi:copper homeostasis protein
VLVSVREAVTIPVHPIIRRAAAISATPRRSSPRCLRYRMVRELGFPGLVTGVLDEDGQVDIPRMKKIMARPGRWR